MDTHTALAQKIPGLQRYEGLERGEAAIIVVGASGQPAIGSVTARLLHGSPVPVALAPHGFRTRPGARVERVTAAFGGSAGLVDTAGAAAATSERRCASPRSPFPPTRRSPPTSSSGGLRSSRRRPARRPPW
jgi:hypothetical protein